MAITAIQDLRWGDTGKGKISEYLSQPERCGVSIRAVGGGNAGHVIMLGTRKIALHLLPAGCVHEGVDLVLGRGMVTHLPTLTKEIDEVKTTFGTDPLQRLFIAKENHILFNGHKAADVALEKRKGKDAVGTTGSGIGPAYADKALRVGMRMEALEGSVEGLKDGYGKLLKHWAETYGVTLDSTAEQQDLANLLLAKKLLDGRITDMRKYWRAALDQMKEGKKGDGTIEGAQGTILSVDSDGYPFVTSSPTTVAGHLQGAGLPWRELTRVIGTLKLYDTRVGNGPMRTELSAEDSEHLRNLGGERGSTTGRNRRVGWLDLEDTKERAWEESVTELAVLKGDVLDPYKVIPLAYNGTKAKVDYAEFPGWDPQSMRGARSMEELPSKARDIYKFIADYTGRPVRYIGTGPESTQLIVNGH